MGETCLKEQLLYRIELLGSTMMIYAKVILYI